MNSSAIALTVGYHDIIIRYFNGGGNGELLVLWTPPGGSSVLIPGNLFHHIPQPNATLAGTYGGAATGGTWSGGRPIPAEHDVLERDLLSHGG